MTKIRAVEILILTFLVGLMGALVVKHNGEMPAIEPIAATAPGPSQATRPVAQVAQKPASSASVSQSGWNTQQPQQTADRAQKVECMRIVSNYGNSVAKSVRDGDQDQVAEPTLPSYCGQYFQ
ncbi:hypothetical protein ACYPKM_04395 [Pseudomonas aeruginosa]